MGLLQQPYDLFIPLLEPILRATDNLLARAETHQATSGRWARTITAATRNNAAQLRIGSTALTRTSGGIKAIRIMRVSDASDHDESGALHQTVTDGIYPDDSPYYMPRRKHPGSSRASRTKSIRGPYADAHARLTAARIPQASVEESNSESFRSVIDDLTVKSEYIRSFDLYGR